MEQLQGWLKWPNHKTNSLAHRLYFLESVYPMQIEIASYQYHESNVLPLGSPMRVEFWPFFWPIFWSYIKNMGIFRILGSGQIQNTSYFSIYVNFWPSYGHLKKKKNFDFKPLKSMIFNIFFGHKIEHILDNNQK